MSNKQFIVISKTKTPDQQQEFDKWYDEEHLRDVVAVPGIAKAQRFRVVNQAQANFETPTWYSVALYEIASEDPQAVIAEINARAGSEAMLISDTIDAEVILQLLVEPMGSVTKPAG